MILFIIALLIAWFVHSPIVTLLAVAGGLYTVLSLLIGFVPPPKNTVK